MNPSKTVPTSVKCLINHTFQQEGRFLVDRQGYLLLKNNNLKEFELPIGENLLHVLLPYFNDLSMEHFERLMTKDEAFEGEFHLHDYQWFRLLISPLSSKTYSYFIIQLFNISQEKENELQLIRHKKNIENEMLLRTREIILTDKAMSSDGGFLQNFLRGLRHDLISPVTQLKELIKYYKTSSDPEKKVKAAELIDGCLQKLSNTSKGFSDFVDLHFVPQAEKEELAFKAIYETVYALLETEINLAQATFHVDFSQSPKILFSRK